MALGASRGRIASQLLVEGPLIAVMGGWLGLLAAPAVSQVLVLLLPENDLTARLDHRVFLFALTVSIMTGGVCGLAPALQAGRRSFISATNERRRFRQRTDEFSRGPRSQVHACRYEQETDQ